jgi:hypothetical protein
MIDIDSFVGGVHGHAKEGRWLRPHRKLGYHPADVSEVLRVGS